MRNGMQKSALAVAAILALALLATSPLAAAPTLANFDLNGVGSGANLAGVYTSPYTGSINSGPIVNVICDDFSDESYVPEMWTAYVNSLSSITSETTNNSELKWGSSVYDGSLSQAQAYEAAAVLSVNILTSTGTAQQDYSFALWALFDPCGNGTNTCNDSNSQDLGAFGQLAYYGDNTDLSNAKSYLSTAVTAVKAGTVNLSNYDVTIYSYDTGAHGACGSSCSQPQEFITVTTVAEPPAPAVLGVDLLGLAGLILFARRYGWLARIS